MNTYKKFCPNVFVECKSYGFEKTIDLLDAEIDSLKDAYHQETIIDRKTVYSSMILETIPTVVGQIEQLVCPDCKLPFTKEELQVKEHCFNCGWEFAN